MRIYLAIILLLVTSSAHAATFERVDEALIGWHYTYEAISQGHQIPVYFTIRKCAAPSIVMAQGYSPIAECYEGEAFARVEAQKWADKEELRYRDVQDPSPDVIKAIKRMWQKAWGQ